MISVMARFLGIYKDKQEVDYWEVSRDLGFMEVLEGVEGAMRGDDVGMPPIEGIDLEGNNNKKPTKYKKGENETYQWSPLDAPSIRRGDVYMAKISNACGVCSAGGGEG